jgi:hypothetical protein
MMVWNLHRVGQRGRTLTQREFLSGSHLYVARLRNTYTVWHALLLQS